jgi:hypothetical protein
VRAAGAALIGPEDIDRSIRQGRALVKAIEGISEIDAAGHIEQLVTQLLAMSCKGGLLRPLPR